jgi:hypothetical protein
LLLDKGVRVRDFAYSVCSPLHWAKRPKRKASKLFTDSKHPFPKASALYDFEGQDENELCFSEKDIIDIIQERDDGWLVGILNGRSGLVPSNHVEPIE